MKWPVALGGITAAGLTVVCVLAAGAFDGGIAISPSLREGGAQSETAAAEPAVMEGLPASRCAGLRTRGRAHPSTGRRAETQVSSRAYDPWEPSPEPAAAPREGKREAEPRRALRARIPDDEGLRLGRLITWSQVVVPAPEAGLVEYDMIGAMPPPGHGEHWETRLAATLLRSLGPASWPADSTFLGWEDRSKRLLVRQTAAGLLEVEAVLDQFTAMGRGALRVRVEAGPGGCLDTPKHLVLDVPWNCRVEAFAGSEYTYLADYDIEISQGAFIAGPMLAQAQDGCRVAAMGVPGVAGAPNELDLVVAASSLRPPFPLLEVNAMSFDTVVIEAPPSDVGPWRGRLAAEPGTRRRVNLDDGTPVTITLLGEVGVLDRSLRTWRRVEADERPASTGVSREALRVTVVRRRDGDVASGSIPLAHQDGSGSAWLRSDPFEPTDFDPDAAGDVAHWDGDLRRAVGGIHVAVTRLGSTSDRTAFDLVLAMALSTGDWREVLARWQQRRDAMVHQARLRLPSIRRAVATRRIVLPPGGAGATSFDLDLGQGPEAYDVTIERVATHRQERASKGRK